MAIRESVESLGMVLKYPPKGKGKQMIVKMAEMRLKEALPESREGWKLQADSLIGRSFPKDETGEDTGEGLKRLIQAIKDLGQDAPTDFNFGPGGNTQNRGGNLPLVWVARLMNEDGTPIKLWRGLKIVNQKTYAQAWFHGRKVASFHSDKFMNEARSCLNGLLPQV